MTKAQPTDNQNFTNDYGCFQLRRYPVRKNDLLRAWDAADEYLLSYLANHKISQTLQQARILLIQDKYGALSVSLAEFNAVLWTDSYAAVEQVRQNLEFNHKTAIPIIYGSDACRNQGKFDVILLKIPKSNAYLRWLLQQIRTVIHEDTLLIAGGMVKHMGPHTRQIFEEELGATDLSLTRKKARLITLNQYCDKPLSAPIEAAHYVWPETSITIETPPGGFAYSGADIGTQFFLKHLPQQGGYQQIVDLACGNGIVGIYCAGLFPNAQLYFTDEAFQSVEYAQANFQRAFPGRQADFVADDCLQRYPGEGADLIMCNPPFHHDHTVSDEIAWQMFVQAKRALKPRGELWIIGNRHLGYQGKLKRLFGNCEQVAANKKFVVLKVLKQI